MSSPYVAPHISSLSDMKSNSLTSLPSSSSSSNHIGEISETKSFVDYVKEKAWIIINIIAVIIITNIIIYLLRRYTTAIDNTYTDKIATWIPWLKKE